MPRKEHDLLGEREIPDDVYWGVHTLRAIENFQISRSKISNVPELVKAYAWVKKATALANNDLGKLSDKKKDAIIKACDLLLDGKFHDQFPVDVFQGGAGTSVNMNANEVIANIALESLGYAKGRYDIIHPNDDVNMSQSTNDSYPTAVRIAFVIAAHNLIREHIEPLRQSFQDKEEEFSRILKMGRTQLQDAVPMTVGQEFGAYAVLMEEEEKSVERTIKLLLEINLGATAIGTGVNAPDGFTEVVTKHLRDVSGLDVVTADNLIEATSDCGAYVSFHSSLKRIAVKLGKICNDLRLLSSGPRAGLHEYNLPERAAGSSIMPAKVNPIIPEVVNQVAFKVIGNDIVVTMAAEAGQLQLNAMEPVIGQSVFESIDLLGNAMDTLRTRCIDGITINEDVCHRYVETSIGLVTYLNTVLGHAACDEIGKECAAEGKTVREVVLEKGLLNDAQLDDILGLDNLVQM